MFKAFFSTILFLSISISFAQSHFVVENPCDSTPFYETTITPNDISLGKLTLNVLDTNKIPHKGTKDGIVSIMNTPYGDDALAIISDFEMFAFGWCFQIDGVLAEYMPDDVLVSKDVKHIRWYYAYAHYVRGEWITQCGENPKIINTHICKK